MRFAVVVVALLLAAGGCRGDAAQDAAITTPTEMAMTETVAPTAQPAATEPGQLDQPYKNSDEGFEIRPPRRWIVDESGSMGTLVLFYSPQSDEHNGSSFTANINILATPSQGMNVEAYATQSMNLMPLTISDYATVGFKRATVNDQEVYFLEYTFQGGSLPIRGRQLYYLDGERAYVITSTALETRWDKYSGTFDASLRSFRR